MTGDAQAVAKAVAADLDIDTVFAEVLPEQKASKVKEVLALAPSGVCDTVLTQNVARLAARRVLH